jgi:addiction module RelE/StbE family toxin
MKLRWLASALLELDRVYGYIAEENPNAARNVFTRIRNATEHLKQFPDSGRAGHINGTREVVLTGLPFLVVYRIRGDYVEILRVFHTSQERGDFSE